MNEELRKALEMITQNIETEEVKSALSKHFDPLASVTKDNAGELIEKHDALKSYRDSAITKAIETWKANNLSKNIEEEIAKRFPAETEADKSLREMKERLAKLEGERNKMATINTVTKKLSEKKLPTDFADFLVGESEEETNTRLSLFESMLSSFREAAVKEVVGENGRIPNAAAKPKNAMTSEQLSELASKDPAKLKSMIEKGEIDSKLLF